MSPSCDRSFDSHTSNKPQRVKAPHLLSHMEKVLREHTVTRTAHLPSSILPWNDTFPALCPYHDLKQNPKTAGV